MAYLRACRWLYRNGRRHSEVRLPCPIPRERRALAILIATVLVVLGDDDYLLAVSA